MATNGLRSLLNIIVPTMDSEKYIDIILEYYYSNNIDVIVYLDTKSKDRTSFILKSRVWGGTVARDLPNNNATRIGEAIEYMSLNSGGKWVLRIDDDELPSLNMLEFVYDAVRRDEADVFSFPRHQCLVSKAGDLLAHSGYDPDKAHRQWRLYRADRVNYRTHGHTPGFHVTSVRKMDAPAEACLIHLDWAVHSYANRKQKVKRYDDHTAGHGMMFYDYYLFEEKGIDHKHLTELCLPEFREVCRNLSRRFPELCVEDRKRGWPAMKNVV